MTEKIAFLFLTRGEHHNIKLWENFFESVDKNSYKIAIHAKDTSVLKSNLWTDKNSIILRPIPTAWGTISLVKATIYLLQMVMADHKIKKFVLLSEFCIPTTDFKNVYDTLMLEKGKSRIHWSFGKSIDRYNIVKSYLTFPAHNWAKQSQWMCLDRNHVNALFIPAYNGKFNQYLNDFKYCPAPDEHFFINYFLHIIKINQKEFINHPITFVDWNTNSKHPKLFAFLPKDVIDHSREHKILFARKFSPLELTTQDINYLLDSKEEPEEPEEHKEPKEPKEPEEPLTVRAQSILDYFTMDSLSLKNKIRDLPENVITIIYNSLFNIEDDDNNNELVETQDDELHSLVETTIDVEADLEVEVEVEAKSEVEIDVEDNLEAEEESKVEEETENQLEELDYEPEYPENTQ
jgi:hypothetical protein